MTWQRRILILSIAAGAAGWLCFAAGTGRTAPPAPATPAAPASAPAAAAPATRLTGEKYPPGKLISACRAKAAKLATKLDKSFEVVVHPPFAVAGDMPRRQVDEHARRSVLAPARAMWASYFNKKPDKVITVLLFKGDKSYRSWAKKLFDDDHLPHFGYYRPADRTLVMNISTGSGTLVHELTHALIAYDFPQVPTWFNEGLASLHEQCTVGQKQITGLTNWRLPGLQAAIKKGSLRPLRELVTRRDFYGRQQGLNYAQARYFCMYMQRLSLLQKFYKHFRANHAGRDADVKAVEHIFGKKLPQIEKAYISWVKTLRFSR